MLSNKFGFKLNPYFCALLPLTMHGLAVALPINGQVVPGSGGAEITSGTNIGGNQFVHVEQSTPNVLINWDAFNIGVNEIVQFNQLAGSSSIAVNRVTAPGQGASMLDGNLNANGRVFVINPNGVLFGATSNVNVGGLLATTFDISDADFNAGRFVFSDGAIGQGQNAGVVLNEGMITVGPDGRTDCCIVIGGETGGGPGNGGPLVDGNGGSLVGGSGDVVSSADVSSSPSGIAVLAGRTVDNQGSINATNGQIVLASGSSLAVSFDNGLISYEVMPRNVEAVNGFAAIRNSGELIANGGAITLLARASGTTPGVGILNSGSIRANGISLDGDGGVYLTLTDGSIESTGTILIQGADVTLDEASISGASQVRIVATSGDVSDELGSGVFGSAIGISATGNVELGGTYESFINSQMPVVPGLEDALDPGSISIQGAAVALDGADINAASLLRVVATTNNVTTSPSSVLSGDALDIQAAGGNVALAGAYSTGTIREVEALVAPSKEGTNEPGSISILGATVDLNGALIGATGPVRIAATAGDVDALSSSNSSSNSVYGTALDIRATAGSVKLAGSYRTEQPSDLGIGVAAIDDGAASPGTIFIQGADVVLDGATIDAENQVGIWATTGNILGLASDFENENDVSGSALDIQAAGSVKLGGFYRTEQPSDPGIGVAAIDDGASSPGTISIQGADVLLDDASIDAANQVRIRATTGDINIMGIPNDESIDVYGSALDFQAAGSVKLSGDYLAGFAPVASVAFVDEASETGDIFIQGSEVIFNNASVTGSGEVRIIATSGDVSDIPVGGSSTQSQITGNAVGVKAARSILLASSSVTVGDGETSIGGDPTVGDVQGVVERLWALYPPLEGGEESASVTARAEGFEITDTSDNPLPPISPSIFVPNHLLPNASLVSGEEGQIRIGELQMNGDYLFIQSNDPIPGLNPLMTGPLFLQFVPAGTGGSLAFEQNPGAGANLNLWPSFFSGFEDTNSTLVFGSTVNPVNVFVGTQGLVSENTDGFNYVLAAGPGGLIFNPERLLTPGEVVVLGQIANGGPLPPVDPPPGPDVLFPSPLPPGQTAEFIAARSEPVPAGARDITFDLAAALDSSIQYSSAVGPVLSCQ